MRKALKFAPILVALVLALTLPQLSAAQSPSNVKITVTATGKKDAPPPDVKKDDVKFTLGKDRRQISDWSKADKLYLAIVIDDSLDTTVGSNWNDIKSFIMTQPANTYIMIGYANNGTVQITQDFTNDHELATKALRLPLGPGAYSSPYLSVIDLMKRWTSTGDRRSLLLISSGIDYFRGFGSGPIYPDVQPAIDRAQRGNINIWSIFFPGSGHRSRGFFVANEGQNNLEMLTDSTGGELWALGTSVPVSFKPYLDEFSTHLANQYMLSFIPTDGGNKGRFQRVRVQTELPNADLFTTDQAWMPPSPKKQ